MKELTQLTKVILAAGGKPFLVGGTVRDMLLKLPAKDYDIEVFGLEAEPLIAALKTIGEVNIAGAAFQVFKVKINNEYFDVSIPRKENKVADGHKGFVVQGNPLMSLEEAANRRDFTVNAICYNLETEEFIDPVGGMKDLTKKVLIAVNEETFVEDSLRVLRGCQFAARFDFVFGLDTILLMRTMDLTDLPGDRLFEEFKKGLLSPNPNVFLNAMYITGVLEQLFPELLNLTTCDQEFDFHPEVNTFTHTCMVLAEAAKLHDDLEEPQALCLMLAALCHDLGKPLTTEIVDGRIRQHGHDEAGEAPTKAVLDKLNVHTYKGFNLRQQVLNLVRYHLVPGVFGRQKDEVSDKAYRKLAQKVSIDLLNRLGKADGLGRGYQGMPRLKPDGTYFTSECEDYFYNRAITLKVDQKPVEPLVTGKDLLNLGMLPTPELGKMKNELYELQLDNKFNNKEEALEYAKNKLTLP